MRLSARHHQTATRRVLAGTPVVAAFSLLLAGCGGHPSAAPAALPSVTVAPATQATVTPWSDFTGQFAAVQIVEVRPRVSGYIARAAFPEGAVVQTGDPLFLIDPRPYAAHLAGARAQLARSQSAVQLAKVEAARAETLFAARAMAREELESRTNGLTQALADEQAAQAAVDTDALNLEWTTVRAPISGRVSRANVTVGNYVQSGATLSPLTTIVSQDSMYVYFNADEQSYLALVRAGTSPGQPGARRTVDIGLADEPAFPRRGRINFIDNQLDATTGTIRVRAVVENPGRRLTPGLFARVHLATGTPYPATLIEDRAVGTDQDKRYVYVVKADSTIDYRPVELGTLDNGLRVVSRGVAPGDRVVVDGLQRVRPGAKVVAQLVTPPADSGGTRVAGSLRSAAPLGHGIATK